MRRVDSGEAGAGRGRDAQRLNFGGALAHFKWRFARRCLCCYHWRQAELVRDKVSTERLGRLPGLCEDDGECVSVPSKLEVLTNRLVEKEVCIGESRTHVAVLHRRR